MAKPLDTESKFMGIFRVSNVYFLAGFAGFFMISFSLWSRLFGFMPTLIGFVVILTFFISYIGVSNSLPAGFFRHWFSYKTSNQVFIPGYEPVAMPSEKEK